MLALCSSLRYIPEHLWHTNIVVNVRASTQINTGIWWSRKVPFSSNLRLYRIVSYCWNAKGTYDLMENVAKMHRETLIARTDIWWSVLIWQSADMWGLKKDLLSHLTDMTTLNHFIEKKISSAVGPSVSRSPISPWDYSLKLSCLICSILNALWTRILGCRCCPWNFAHTAVQKKKFCKSVTMCGLIQDGKQCGNYL